jgi:protein ImuB
MVVCVHIPRFELAVAAGGGRWTAQQSLSGRALALAPAPGGAGDRATGARVGEVSGAAEACGVARGMLLGEALARCPELVLIPADPVRAEEAWEEEIGALERIGAAVEPACPGLAYFEAGGLEGLYGDVRGTIAAARRGLGRPARLGAGPTRFCALAAALHARSRRALVLEDPPRARRWLAGRPVGLLAHRDETAPLLEALERLGVRTLGELVAIGADALADRFGATGALAHRLARGEDEPLRPRTQRERLQESMEVGDAGSGAALGRVLGVLVDRVLARPERRGRTLRAVTLSARLVAGGGWREPVVFRQALGDPERIRLALSVRLALLPAPAAALRLAVDGFGPPAGEQDGLLEDGPSTRAERTARLQEAVAQLRALAGRDAALRAVCVDVDSRVPERRVILAPLNE